jgi:hypothetical protein
MLPIKTALGMGEKLKAATKLTNKASMYMPAPTST